MSKVIGHYVSEKREGIYTLTEVWVCVGETQKLTELIANANKNYTDPEVITRVVGQWQWLLDEGYRETFEWSYGSGTGFTAKYQQSPPTAFNPSDTPFLTGVDFHGKSIAAFQRGLALLRACRSEKRGPYDRHEAIPNTPRALLERIDRYANVSLMWPDNQGRRWSDWVVKGSGPIRMDGSQARARALPKAVAA